MQATYLIPAENAERFKAKLDKLVKRAKKLEAGAIDYYLAKTWTRPHPDPERAEEGELETIEAYTVTGEAPTLNGWQFVATLQHEEAADGKKLTLLRTVGNDVLPVRFRTATPDDCDHCRTHRYRTDTFVVRHAETGEHKQVGRTCLKDFLGHASPHAVAQFATLLALLEESLGADCEEGYGSGGERAFELATFLAWTVCAIEHCGWTSRTKAKELGVAATADLVLGRLYAKTKKEREQYGIPEPTEVAYKEVAEALAWLEAQDSEGNDYLYNCQAIAELGVVKERTAGYAASIVSSHRRAKEKVLRRAVLSANGTDHVGTEGKRGEFWLTLLAVHEVDGYYGTTHIHKFADRDGNAVVWFASNPMVVPGDAAGHGGGLEWGNERMIKGATYRVKATVKEHGAYDGQPQTKVTRVAVQLLTRVRKKRRKKAQKKLAEVA